jgi:hypothetical protein
MLPKDECWRDFNMVLNRPVAFISSFRSGLAFLVWLGKTSENFSIELAENALFPQSVWKPNENRKSAMQLPLLLKSRLRPRLPQRRSGNKN